MFRPPSGLSLCVSVCSCVCAQFTLLSTSRKNKKKSKKKQNQPSWCTGKKDPSAVSAISQCLLLRLLLRSASNERRFAGRWCVPPSFCSSSSKNSVNHLEEFQAASAPWNIIRRRRFRTHFPSCRWSVWGYGLLRGLCGPLCKK